MDPVDICRRLGESKTRSLFLELTADGWAIPEIAVTLDTTVERISDEKYKAVKKLRHHFGTV